MKYIKKARETEAYNILDFLLKNCWNDHEGRYFNADFEDLKRKEFSEVCKKTFGFDFLQILAEEQSDMCCYCMRKLEREEISLEHVIPQHPKVGDYERYISGPINTSKMIQRSEFDLESKQIPPDQYPHDIAYHNLLCACQNHSSIFDARCKANNLRGNKYMEPWAYIPDIESRYQVEEDGLLYSENEPLFRDLNEILQLNQTYLRELREAWHKLVDQISPKEMEEISDFSERLELLRNGIPEMRSLHNEAGWNNILKYKWFYEYFKNRIPSL